MNSKLLKAALEKIQSVPVLINMVSKRERELINGAKPLVNPDTLLTDEARAKHYTALDVDKSDIALAEIAQGKLPQEPAEVPSEPAAEEEEETLPAG